MSDSESAPVYGKAMVTFIDILGFRQLIEVTRKESAKVATVAALLTSLKQRSSEGGRVHRTEDGKQQRIFHSFNFSDLTVRCTEVPNGASLPDYLNWELLYVGDLQLALLRERVLIRGGICLGDVFVDQERQIVFGPALVKSYRLESEYAVFPRIVVDRAYLASIESGSGGRYWPEYVRQGDDGAYYLDYLYGTVLTSYESSAASEHPTTLLAAHRDVILAEINDDIRKKDERLRQKYMWLALYHNSTLARLSARFNRSGVNTEKFEEFAIPAAELNF
ncbi:MAG: hypothetical protein ACM3JB_22725 [Acidobacteriaceae bacterium]